MMKRIFLLSAAALLAVVGCTEKAGVQEGLRTSDEMAFSPVNASGNIATRGYVESVDFEETYFANLHTLGGTPVPREMQMSAYLYPQDGYEGNYFVNKTFAKEDDELWHANPAVYWPVGGIMDFLSYSLTTESQYSKGITVEWDKENAAQQVVLDVPAENSQNDILFASASSVKAQQPSTALQMQFNHAQAWLEFAITGKPDGVIKFKKIELVKVYNAGKLTISNNNGNALAQWDFTGETAQNIEVDNFNDAADMSLTGNKILYLDMLIPQQAKTAFVLYYTLGLSDQVLSYRFETDQKTWLMGEKYVYNIEINTNEVTVEPKVTEWGIWKFGLESKIEGGDEAVEYTGGTTALTVSSILHDGKSQTGAPWKLQYFDGTDWVDAEAGEQIDEWVSFDVVNGNEESTTVTATVADATLKVPLIKTIDGNHMDAVLENNSEKKPYDLSKYDIYGNQNNEGKSTTANCYVVSKAGWYAFPLVYGNAIKNGVANASAYEGKGPSIPNVLGPFVNANDEGITKPEIEKDLGEGTYKAEVIWQDIAFNALINNPKDSCYVISSEEAALRDLAYTNSGYIVFKVDKESFAQGNAMIALKKGDDIVWSWNIWAYPSDKLLCKKGKTDAGNPGNDVYLMPVNLGYVDREMTRVQKIYVGKSIDIRIAQETEIGWNYSEKKTVSRAEKTDGMINFGGDSNVYQWGRKDAMMRYGSSSMANAYSGKNTTGLPNDTGGRTIGAGIKQPTYFYYVTPMYDNTKSAFKPYYNLWSASCINYYWHGAGGSTDGVKSQCFGYCDTPTKTIYDPCPPGFQVPQADAFENVSEWTITGNDRTYHGMTFPVCHYRSMDTSYYTGGTGGYFWCCVPCDKYDSYKAYVVGFTNSPEATFVRERGWVNCGYGVRPAKEK